MTDVVVVPSLLAADPTDLRSAVAVLDGQADVFHVDVMDGHFVPNITFGPEAVAALRPLTTTPLDVHLMVSNPDEWVPRYAEAGADWISLHAEATPHLERSVSQIREHGARAGVVLNPATSFAGLEYVLQDGDFVLVMSVNPGYGGQSFLPRSVDKIRALRSMLDAAGLDGVDIEVDGGVALGNARALVEAGTRILVAGSSIVGAADPVAAARLIRDRALGR